MHDFIITLNLAYLGRQLSSTHGTQKGYANQLMVLLRIADLNEVKATEHANIRMTAEQFAEFIYLRAAAGATNGIKELQARRVPSNQPTDVYLTRDLTGTDLDSQGYPKQGRRSPALDDAISVVADINMSATGSASASTGGMSHYAAEIDTLRAMASKVEDAQIVSICGGIEVDRISALDLVYDEIHKREQAIASMFTSNRQQ
ncbi:hypothetical protein [Pseudomonas phage KPP25]|uniref:Uncharacterized protein n=1 Tax=Pseudomonas phage KPP25 TaxID=1462608 RepID=X5IEN4_BPKP2|nr:hypothetical protein FF13_gp45 [Pseudomonas phage KPP25]BAO58517.1 hypothetical protein [Pseudomonas phage KPP25]